MKTRQRWVILIFYWGGGGGWRRNGLIDRTSVLSLNCFLIPYPSSIGGLSFLHLYKYETVWDKKVKFVKPEWFLIKWDCLENFSVSLS